MTTRHEDAEADAGDGVRNVGHEKRQKLNLLKCNQCRLARKKVASYLPYSRQIFALTQISVSQQIVSGLRGAIAVSHTGQHYLTVPGRS
jgi:hypothetical protein